MPIADDDRLIGASADACAIDDASIRQRDDRPINLDKVTNRLGVARACNRGGENCNGEQVA